MGSWFEFELPPEKRQRSSGAPGARRFGQTFNLDVKDRRILDGEGLVQAADGPSVAAVHADALTAEIDGKRGSRSRSRTSIRRSVMQRHQPFGG